MKFDIHILEGKHKLTGVALSTTEDGYVFEIDGKKYVVYEQEDDEYRSNCAIEEIEDGGYYSKIKILKIPEQDVEIIVGDTYCSDYYPGVEFDQFEILNADDKSAIFVAWTEDWHDYYPCAQFSYYPENLPINK